VVGLCNGKHKLMFLSFIDMQKDSRSKITSETKRNNEAD
jgi:hypothetical protein